MPGQIKKLIDKLIMLRTKGDSGLIAPVKIKLIMKGIDPDTFNEASPDNPAMIHRIVSVAKEMGFEL